MQKLRYKIFLDTIYDVLNIMKKDWKWDENSVEVLSFSLFFYFAKLLSFSSLIFVQVYLITMIEITF